MSPILIFIGLLDNFGIFWYTTNLAHQNLWGSGYRLQNVAHWHTEQSKLKESGKQQSRKVSLIRLPPWPLKQIIRPSYERCPPYIQRKRASLSLTQWQTPRSLAKCPPVYHTILIFPNLYSSTTVHSSSKLAWKHRFNYFFGSLSSYGGSYVT